MKEGVEYQIRPDAILVHSRNIAVMEQASFLCDDRTIVLVCTGGQGFAAVGKRAPKKGYLTIERWCIEYPGAVSFNVPNSVILSIQMVKTSVLEKRYHKETECWEHIRNATRYHGVTLVPPDNALA